MGRLDGRVAVITGAGSGIGRETALRFAGESAAVAVADVAEESGRETVDAIEAAGGSAHFVRCDVSRAEDCARLFDETSRQLGRVDCLVNNAGIFHGDDSDPVATDEAVWDLTMAVNAKGVWLCCKHGIPRLLESGGGTIVNVSSFQALMGSANPQTAYAASKGAVLAMTRELAVTYARQGIRVNAVCPGPVRTPLLEELLSTEERRQHRLVHIPLDRFAEASEIADAILFLASDESSYITGTAFLVDGGASAAYFTSPG